MSVIVNMLANAVISGKLELESIGNVGNLHNRVAAKIKEITGRDPDASGATAPAKPGAEG